MPANRRNTRSKRNVSPHRRATQPASKRDRPDNVKTVAEWKALPTEALRLKCNAYGVQTARKPEMAERLFAKFHPTPPGTPDPQEDDPDAILRVNPDDIIDNNGVITESGRDNEKRDGTESNSTVPYDGAVQNGARTSDVNNALVDANSVQSMIDDAMRPLLDQLEAGEQDRDLRQREVSSLRSEIARLRKQQTQQTQPQASRNASTGARKRTNQSAPVTPVVPAHTSDADDDVTPIGTATGNLSNSNVTASPDTIGTNPLPLPPLTKSQFEAIEKGDYVDFNKLKPKELIDLSREEGQDGFDVRFCHSADESGVFKMRKDQTNAVRTFTEWLEAWNMFLAARIHFCPHDQHVLLIYQASITHKAREYKFNAVYQYDISFRKMISAERTLFPQQRSTRWETDNIQLMNLHLYGHMIPAPTCFKCGAKEHMAAKCPQRSGGYGKQPYNKYYGSRNNNHNQQQPNTLQQQYPYPQPPQYAWAPFGGHYQSQQTNNPQVQQRPRSNVANATAGGGNKKNDGTCNFFNHKGHCFRGPTCPFKHVCNKCSQPDHGGINCKNVTSTSFVPPTTTSGPWAAYGPWAPQGPWPAAPWH